ncbi:UDP-N-acetylmuramate--L-alanine ligase [Chromatiales bacterium (ex Bugula neritina AB1)]|nr:UDP-N-acetylmuramate--L-alanine ligase [Chromatiales bacterium (ex Bugula neritina AB1)]
MPANSAGIQSWMRRIDHVHFVGIGGVGMGGIAEVMVNLGYSVSGSDTSRNALVQRLESIGARVYSGHNADNVAGVDVVVVSSAIAEDNPEVMTARQNRIPVIRRAEMLGELMRFKQGIAIAGTHGKTTTTSLVASLLTEGGMDPTYVIGGKLISSSTNAYLGQSEWLVAEADESDASFLSLQPVIAIVTNIDADHLSSYENDFDRLKNAFVEFLQHLPFYGLAVMCIDDDTVKEILDQIARPVMTYGFDPEADVVGLNFKQDKMKSCFDVKLPDGSMMRQITLNLPGVHNALNALAAVAVGWELGLRATNMRRALQHFQGIGRRAQSLGQLQLDGGFAELYDDYGHHPREVAATLEAIANGTPDNRLVVVFQPHRYTRTRELFDDFTDVLCAADVLLLTEVYPAGEQPIAGADGRALARAIRQRGVIDPIFVPEIDELARTLRGVLIDGDVVLTLGAGSIGAVAASLPDAFLMEDTADV